MMTFKEFLQDDPLLEGQNLDVYNDLLPLLLVPDDMVVEIFANGNMWLNQLYTSVKNYAIATRITDRMKELGVGGEGAKRVRNAAKSAANSVRSLLNNPGAVAYKIPTWTTVAPPKPVIPIWNEAFSREFAKEMSALSLSDEAS
jgi:hypothetical protein